MAMTTVAVRLPDGTTIGVLAERVTAHLAIHPLLVADTDGDTCYDQSALEITHVPTGAFLCMLDQPGTVRYSQLRTFANWLEAQTDCCTGERAGRSVLEVLPGSVRREVRRFCEAPNFWHTPTTVAATGGQS